MNLATMLSAFRLYATMDRTTAREELTARIAQQRAALVEEKRQADAARRAAEQQRKKAREERHRLVIQRCYHALQSQLSTMVIKSNLGPAMPLPMFLGHNGQATVNKFASQVINILAAQLARED